MQSWLSGTSAHPDQRASHRLCLAVRFLASDGADLLTSLDSFDGWPLNAEYEWEIGAKCTLISVENPMRIHASLHPGSEKKSTHLRSPVPEIRKFSMT